MNSDSIVNEAIVAILEDPEIFHFKVDWLNSTESNETQLLELFCYGTVCDWQQRWPQLPLTNQMLVKLQKLTLITMCLQNRKVTYSTLLEKTGILNYQILEEHLISLQCFFQCKLDPVEGIVTIGKLIDSRDVYAHERPLLLLQDLDFNKSEIIKNLQNWKTKLANQLADR